MMIVVFRFPAGDGSDAVVSASRANICGAARIARPPENSSIEDTPSLLSAIANAIMTKWRLNMTFSEVLKDIRAQQHYTQEKLARELNVSFSTINRWENNKTTPSELAKMHIIEYCNKNMIDKRTIDLLLKIE
jgi:DNA-binding XRE family transcriptional regulator